MSDESMHSALVGPGSDWWKPAGRQEKIWVTVSFIWCIFMFAAMPFWHFKGGQNPSGTRGKVDPMAFYARTQKFIEDYSVGTDQGIPVVEPPAGSEVYLLGQMWMWSPVLKLKKGVEYTIHLSSLDLNHGFGLFPVNINIQVVPGYDYALKMTPTEAGEFKIICNEFCGIGHHLMIGKIIVED
ncbi:MAG: cytochrome C oxidase subunit II [Kiritimatiellae bacterium]|nr:cytochrome C oxidase subunit II [Kiritimatiellia bacterium]MCO5061528.1 cytochrome C oxidase subunit II [Kiritimatiellia bacterium]MCO5067308.1 cytochrome C oxidase subunit II [Kiritimatiellia bacterium]